MTQVAVLVAFFFIIAFIQLFEEWEEKRRYRKEAKEHKEFMASLEG